MLFAGATVIVALLGLLVLGVSFLNGVAVASAIVVLTTMTAAVTLIPALLGMFGMRVLSRKERRRLEAEGPRDPKLDGFWPRWADSCRSIASRSPSGALIFMLALAVPALSLRLGLLRRGPGPGLVDDPQGVRPAGQGVRAGLQRHVPDRREDPERQGGPAEGAEARRRAGRDGRPRGGGPAGAVAQRQDRADRGAPDHGAAGRGDQPADRHAAQRRRPGAPAGLPVYVGGITAIFDDFAGVLTDKLPLFIAVIVLLGCLLLMIAFRSLLIPLTAAVMNLLAAGAAFGVVTAVFQKGLLAGPLGVGTGPIEAFLPVMMLAILFGLSMDYQVFLVSRMHEEWVHTHDNAPLGPDRAGRDRPRDHRGGHDHDPRVRLLPARRAARDRRVRHRPGQRGAARRVHPAHVLVPATMHLIGKRNWWLPRELDRALPRVAVEAAET